MFYLLQVDSVQFVQFVFYCLFISLHRNFPTGCDKLAVATDRQRHEDQEYSSPRAHCKCNDQGICVFLYLCIYVCADSH